MIKKRWRLALALAAAASLLATGCSALRLEVRRTGHLDLLGLPRPESGQLAVKGLEQGS